MDICFSFATTEPSVELSMSKHRCREINSNPFITLTLALNKKDYNQKQKCAATDLIYCETECQTHWELSSYNSKRKFIRFVMHRNTGKEYPQSFFRTNCNFTLKHLIHHFDDDHPCAIAKATIRTT